MYNGSIRRNPSDLDCFKACSACFRCEDKGKYAKCNSCSGRHDPALKKDPHDIDDRCRCSEGILQIRMQNGKLMQRQYPHNPYTGAVQTEQKTEDEKEWDAYLQEKREQLDDENYDPIQFEDGSSTSQWLDQQRKGS